MYPTTTIPVTYSQRPTMPAPRDERLSLVPLSMTMFAGDDVTVTVRPPAQDETTKDEE